MKLRIKNSKKKSLIVYHILLVLSVILLSLPLSSCKRPKKKLVNKKQVAAVAKLLQKTPFQLISKIPNSIHKTLPKKKVKPNIPTPKIKKPPYRTDAPEKPLIYPINKKLKTEQKRMLNAKKRLDSRVREKDYKSNRSKYSKTKSRLKHKKHRIKKKKPFTFQTEPPKGFAFLTAPQDTLADVYHEGSYIGSFMVTYTPTYIIFKNPRKLVHLIHGVTNKPLVIHALTGKLATNSKYAYNKKRKIYFRRRKRQYKAISPKIAAVAFNRQVYRVDVYVNGKYIHDAKPRVHLLPPSDAGFSFAQKYTGIVAGGRGYNTYNLVNNSVLAYKQAKINLGISYLGNTRGNGDYPYNYNPRNKLLIQKLNAEYYKNNYKVAAGYLYSYGNAIFGTQNILGLSMRTTLDTVAGKRQAYGSQLTVFLNTPSQVAIFKDGKLVFSDFYQAGNQILDTSALPDGAYPVLIDIRGGQGSETKIRKFYVKTSRLPPKEFPIYYLDLGILSDQYYYNSLYNSDSIFPALTKSPFYQLGVKKRISDSWGFTSAITGTDKASYIGEGVYLQGVLYQFDPQVMIGSDNAYGLGVSSRLTFNRVYINVFARQLWKHAPEHRKTYSCLNAFCPVSATTTQATSNIVFPIPHGSLAFNADIIETKGLPRYYSYGSTATFYFSPWHLMPTTLNLSINKSQDKFAGMATLTVYLSRVSDWSANATIGQGAWDNKGLIANASINKSWLDAAQNGLNIGGNAGTHTGIQTMGALADYSNGIGYLRGNVQNNSGKNTKTNTQYNASYSNNIVWTGNKVAVGGARYGQAGIVMYIKSNYPGKFKVLANDRVVKIVRTNHPTPIFLRAFKTYSIRIIPYSKTFFAYDQTPKQLTLYKGNFKQLTWSAHRKLIIFTRVVNTHNKPITNTLLKGGIGLNFTDEDGTLQAEVLDNTKRLTLLTGNKTNCTIILPPLHPKDGLVEFKKVICYSHKRNKLR